LDIGRKAVRDNHACEQDGQQQCSERRSRRLYAGVAARGARRPGYPPRWHEYVLG
jgi:hypothetical protein